MERVFQLATNKATGWTQVDTLFKKPKGPLGQKFFSAIVVEWFGR